MDVVRLAHTGASLVAMLGCKALETYAVVRVLRAELARSFAARPAISRSIGQNLVLHIAIPGQSLRLTQV